MIRFIILLIANGATIFILARVMPNQVSYQDDVALVIFALVLGLLNVLIRPILQLIALPLTCLTLGLFALVVNAAVFWLAAWLSVGVEISYLGAFVGSLVAALLNGLLSSLVRDRN